MRYTYTITDADGKSETVENMSWKKAFKNIIAKDNKAQVVIGFSNVATNRVTIPVECEEFSDTEPISFNANMFANILQANKECEKAVLKVSSDGLATISFNIDDYKSEYFLVATQQVT